MQRCLNKSQGWFPLGFVNLTIFLQWKCASPHFVDVLRSKLPVEVKGSSELSALFIDYGFSCPAPDGEIHDDGST